MASNIYYSILSAVGAVCASVAGINEVSVRRKPLQLDGVDPLPHAIVWPGPGAEKIDELQFGPGPGQGFRAWVLYPVTVALLTSGNRVVATDLSAYMDLRERTRNALFKPLLGGAVTVFDCEIDPRDVFDLEAFTKGNFDVTGWTLSYRSSELLGV